MKNTKWVDDLNQTLNFVNPWREILYNLFKFQSNPLLVTDDAIYTADVLWNLSRLWTHTLSQFKIAKGDSILVHFNKSADLLSLIIASLFNEWNLILINPKLNLKEIVEETNPKFIITDEKDALSKINSKQIKSFQKITILDFDLLLIQRNHGIQNKQIRFFLRSSGTELPKWIGLTDREIFYNLEKHQTIYSFHTISLSILPWYHVFGLILDLLSLLLKKATIIIDEKNGRDPEYTKFLVKNFPIKHCSFVPLQLELQIENHNVDFLFQLESGIIGGAKISYDYIEILKKTKLRVGYGQTEAGPGISIGEEGEWEENYVGRPLCNISFKEDHELVYSGENVYQYEIQNGEIIALEPYRWVESGDILYFIDHKLYFEGRKTEHFKLKNGKWFYPSKMENFLKKELGLKHILFLPDQNNDIIIVLPKSQKIADIIFEYISNIQPYISHVLYVNEDEFAKTPKGDIDRKKIKEMIYKRYLYLL